MLKDDFLALWERETNQRVDKVLFGEGRPSKTLKSPKDESSQELVYPESFFDGRSIPWGVKFRAQKAKPLSDLRANLPLQPGDALWLFHRFLEE